MKKTETIKNNGTRTLTVKTLLDGDIDVPIGKSVTFKMKGDKPLGKHINIK